MAVEGRTKNLQLKKHSNSFGSRLHKDLRKNYDAYLLILPALLFYILFCYKPMAGAVIAFKDYIPAKGIWGSPWAGLKHFEAFFGSYYFQRLLLNTVVISLVSLVIGFPAPIVFALLLNEVRNMKFKRTVQTITYMPHFISLVVVCSLIRIFTMDTGVIVQLLALFGFEPVSLLTKSRYFVPVYVLSDIWQHIGWGSILYLSALSSIDPTHYEAAVIDGAGRWKQTLHVTLPGISSTIIIMFILRAGSIMNVGFEKIILLYNEGIYETSDVISTFVYRKGLEQFQWSYSGAVGLFNSIINFVIVIIVNKISRRVSETSLW
ncbi:MAG: ABC transporter permease subunit [Clostridiales bacterium]|nr:ABC transporter permease subunit [Clostridiales bacterium]